MDTYSLLPEGFDRIKKRWWLFYLAMFLFFAAVIFYSGLRGELYQQSPSAFALLAVTSLATMLVVGGLMAYFQIRSQRQLWFSYQLIISPQSVIKKQRRMPDIEIERDQITSLQELPSKGLLIKTEQRRQFIFVPASVEHYDEVKERLAQWRQVEPIPQRTAKLRQTAFYLLTLAGAAAMITAMKSQDAWIVFPLGLLLVPFFLWGLIEIQRSPQVDRRFKTWSWLMLLPVFSLVMKMILVLS